MEEPELTLVSINDTSISEKDFGALKLEEDETKAQSIQDTHLGAGHRQHIAEHSDTSPQLPILPGSLQEAFLTRNKAFIERSAQRQKELQLRSKTQSCENSKNKALKPRGSDSCLKGMCKMGASPPLDTKALRSYNQIAQVKQQREDGYTRNRAKEFHKKALEKLRAKNTY